MMFTIGVPFFLSVSSLNQTIKFMDHADDNIFTRDESPSAPKSYSDACSRCIDFSVYTAIIQVSDTLGYL